MNAFGSSAARRTLAMVLTVAALAAACGSSASKASDKSTTTTTAISGSTTKQSSNATTPPPDNSTPTSSTPGGSGDFCSKISDAQVKAVLGVDVTRREPHSAAGSQSCIKGSQRQNDITKFAYVSFSTYPAVGPMASADKVKASLPGAKVVSGVGDEAVYSPTTGAVFAFRGGKVAMVQVVKGGKPGGEADVVSFAKTLSSHLG